MTQTQKILVTIIHFLCLSTQLTFAQNQSKNPQEMAAFAGLSVQVYPAGIITTLNSDIFLTPKSSLHFRLGANFADRKDFSDYNDNEKGSGFGGTLGFRKHFPLKKGEITAGLNTDLWNMWINWKNNIGLSDQTQGKTYTLVLQPWIESGYFTEIKKSPFQFGITAGFGREINIVTDGKEVGQGWMLSGLLHLNYIVSGE